MVIKWNGCIDKKIQFLLKLRSVKFLVVLLNKVANSITFFTALFIFSFCAYPTVKVTRYFGLNGRSCIFEIKYQHTKHQTVEGYRI